MSKQKTIDDIVAFVRQFVDDNTKDPRFASKIEQLQKSGSVVVAVVENTLNIWGEKMDLVSYCMFTQEDIADKGEDFMYWFNQGIIFTYTDNLTVPDFSEYGSIGFKVVDRKIIRRD